MAEVLLLLLFCLMMAVAAVHQRSDPERLREELESTKAELSDALEEQTSIKNLGIKNPSDPETIKAIKNALDRLRDGSEGLNEKLSDLAKLPISPKTLEGLVRLLSSLDRDQLTRLADTTSEDVVSATELAELNPIADDWRELKEYQKLLQTRNPKPRMAELSDALEEQTSIKNLGIKNPSDPETIKAIKNALDRLRDGSEGLNEWPPIINLSEASNNFFERGSAVLAKSFITSLEREVTVKLAKTLDEYNVDLIEVIGHTDEQPISNRPTNLDTQAVPVLLGFEPTSSLATADNAGLGLARAIAVTRVLSSQPALKGVSILPYSAGHLVLPNEATTNGADARDEKTRRRIEIRVRRKEPKQ